MTRSTILSEKMRSSSQGLCLFGVVPPPKRISFAKVEEYVEKLASSLSTIACDGIIVYDIQEEKGRCDDSRPFPFSETHEPRLMASMLKRLAGVDAIVYRAVADHPREIFDDWLTSTWEEHAIQHLVLVGGSSSSISYPGYSVPEAAKVVREHRYDYMIGGITIPERHRDKGCEHEILLKKTEQGVTFFTSQVVYNADNVICVLKDYDALCKAKGVTPSRIILAFAPFGSEETVKFLRWLGVELPDGTVRRVLSRGDIQARIQESIDICVENMKRILSVCRKHKLSVPLGVTVESVSRSKEEAEGALELFTQLRHQIDCHLLSKHNRPRTPSPDLTQPDSPSLDCH